MAKVDWSKYTLADIMADPILLAKYAERRYKRRKTFKYIAPIEVAAAASEYIKSKHGYYIETRLETAKVKHIINKMWDELITSYEQRLPLYRFSTMWLLGKTFSSEVHDIAFRLQVPKDYLYGELKTLYLCNLIADLFYVHNKSSEFVIEDILDRYGIGTLSFLKKIFLPSSWGLVDKIYMLVLKRRFLGNTLELHKDRPFPEVVLDLQKFVLTKDLPKTHRLQFYVSERKHLSHDWEWQLADD